MGRNTVILSPEHNNVGRREGVANGDVITGTVCFYDGGLIGAQVEVNNTAPMLKLIAVDNVSTAQGLDYIYGAGENVFLQSLPAGTLCNLKAHAGTYNGGDMLEVGAQGGLQAVTTGIPFAVVPSFSGETITGLSSLMVELL